MQRRANVMQHYVNVMQRYANVMQRYANVMQRCQALHYAVSRNALQSLTVMLEYCRHTINVPDANGRTALHAACAEGIAGIVYTFTPGLYQRHYV